ncbi:beta-lactamase-like protein [Mycena crocata]|nr:beta-lactamase-like protein [Mycena crocata]
MLPFRLSRAFSVASRMQIVPVRLDTPESNYAYLIIDTESKQAAVVDPYDVSKVTSAADGEKVQIVAGITTHHHSDHSGGNQVFASTYPDAAIYAGSHEAPAATHIVKDRDEFTIGKNIRIKCLATPCHTQDSICFHATDASDANHPGAVFTGDTLFIAGCGRFFEGTGEEMDKALSYLGTLPDETLVYTGHEYTAGNLAFGKAIDPENADIERLAELVRTSARKNEGITQGLSTIGDEKAWNVFMRLKDAAVRRAAKASADTSNSAVINALREQKNKFRG